ncbi:MAG: hypothetical protein ACYTGG_03900 [Planctomycetota bacterium]
MVGIVISDDRLRQRIDRRFHWPMIVLALLVLPLVALELFWTPQRGTALWWVSAVGITVIWTAFVAEFIIKIAIAECRIEYVRRNWLDIIIIALPALRPLRATAVVRTTKVFRLRGIGMKLARYVFTFIVGLEATERLLHRIGLKARRDRTDPRHMTRHQLMQEVKRLRRLADAWEDWHEAYAAHREQHDAGSDPLLPPPPTASDETDAPDAASDCDPEPDSTISRSCGSPSPSSTPPSVTSPGTPVG